MDKRVLLRDALPWASVGEESYGGLSVARWDDKTRLTIGSYCSFSFGSKILLGGEHRSDWVTTFPFSALWEEARGIEGHPATKGDVGIGSDVCVGAEAMVLSGVIIGHGAVVGARSVVTRDVQPYAIVAGNPARLVRYRFGLREIEALLEVAWWGWPREKVARALPWLLQPDVWQFIARARAGEFGP